MAKALNIKGERHGTLTADRKGEPYISPKGQKLTQWYVVCDCGAEKLVPLGNFRRGSYVSCGKAKCKGPSKRRLTQKEFDSRIAEHFPDDIAKVSSPFIHLKENVEITCPKHPTCQPRLASELAYGNYTHLCS